MVNHLRDKHYIEANDVNGPQFEPKKGPIDKLMANRNKRAAEVFTPEAFSDALLRFLITNKLPLSLVNDGSFQDLLYLSNDAPSKACLKLPSNDTVGKKVHVPISSCEISLTMPISRYLY
jgi:hypothetical protein